jgi:hypothetical protein
MIFEVRGLSLLKQIVTVLSVVPYLPAALFSNVIYAHIHRRPPVLKLHGGKPSIRVTNLIASQYRVYLEAIAYLALPWEDDPAAPETCAQLTYWRV